MSKIEGRNHPEIANDCKSLPNQHNKILSRDDKKSEDEYEPVGQEMLELMVHQRGDLTGDQIIELTELAHKKEMELRQRQQSSIAARVQSGSEKNSNRDEYGSNNYDEENSNNSSNKQNNHLETASENPFADGLGENEDWNGFLCVQQKREDNPRVEGSGAKRIQRLLELEENEIIEDEVEKQASLKMEEQIESHEETQVLNKRNIAQRSGRGLLGFRQRVQQSEEGKLVLNCASKSQGRAGINTVEIVQSGRLVLPAVKSKPLGSLRGAGTKTESSDYQSHKQQKAVPAVTSGRNGDAEKENMQQEATKSKAFALTTAVGFMAERHSRSYMVNRLQKSSIFQRNVSRQLLDESREVSKDPVKPLLQQESTEEDPNPYINLPRTGIEQAFLVCPPQHVRQTHDLERINDLSQNLKSSIIEDYRLRESSRVINLAKTVYDVEKDSPHYRYQKDFLDPTSCVRITKNLLSGKVAEQNRVPLKNKYFKELKPWFVPYKFTSQPSSTKGKQLQQEQDDTLIFESRFESGNLKEAIQLDRNEYELVLKPDYGTRNYTQWFYFRIGNTRRHREYIFHIINFVKPDSLFNDGMMPLFYSKAQAESTGIGWYRGGYDIAYYQNNQPYCKMFGEQPSDKAGQFVGASKLGGVGMKEPQSFYTLSFKFTLKNDNDEVYISICYPYTFTELQAFLDRVTTSPTAQSLVRRTTLCKTIAGNPLEMLLVTNFASSQSEISRRKCVILSSRVHPGESNSSFVMEGLIEFLLSSEEVARVLRDRFVFKIVPMLNPDGVIVGNYRCSLSGLDLNRQYAAPSVKAFPEVFAIKQMLRKTLECRRIELYCDFHGHSRQKDLFMYGCSPPLPATGACFGGYEQKPSLKERVFPLMFDRMSNHFNFQGSSFVVHKTKESTGRVVVWREFQISNSYTCEASFCGPSQGYYRGFHFNIRMLLEMGKDFCRTLAAFSEIETGYYRQILNELQSEQHVADHKANPSEEKDFVFNDSKDAKKQNRIQKLKEKRRQETDQDSLRGILNVFAKSSKVKKA